MYLDPTNDVAFKKIFGNENKKEILISFLNSILNLKGNKKIKKVTILNPYQAPKLKDLKETILDVRCEDEREITYIVEMQISKPTLFDKRILYYTSKAYVNQIEIGEDYPKLNQVIFLGILYFNMFQGEKYISNHLILDEETGENKLKDFRFCFVELPKFNKEEEELDTIEDKWIYFLKEAKKLKIIPEKIYEEEIKEAFKIIDRFNWTKEELEIYDTISIYRQDERGRVEQALIEGIEKGLEKGKKEGLKEGLEKGKKEGLKEGLEKGKREEKLEITKNLLDILDVKTIAMKTGLSEKEIENLVRQEKPVNSCRSESDVGKV